MGQRLVITIEDKNGLLAKAYYHWSGYTHSGLAITNIAVKHFESAVRTATSAMAVQRITNANLTEDDFAHRTKVAIACHMLFATNAGLETTETSPEDEAFKNMFPGCNYVVGVNRSDGLIAITENGMHDLQIWSEADVIINIDTKSVNVSGLFFGYDPTDDENDNTSQRIELAENMNELSFEELPEFTAKVVTAIKNKIYSFTCNGDNISAIE